LTPFLGLTQGALAAQTQQVNPSGQQSEQSASSSQPLWSYQIKPTNYVGTQFGSNGGPQSAPYTAGVSSPFPSIFDAFTGLSQRQGALTTSPFMSILPIILIAAGGFLLLLPLFTMMVASPFGGAFGGAGYQGPFGYPQVGALSKKRSVDGNQRGIIELIENFSSTIEELSRKYSPSGSVANQQAQQQQGAAQQLHKRSPKAFDESHPAATQQTPSNHKPALTEEQSNSANSLLLGANLHTNN